MTRTGEHRATAAPIVISVDAMGGDRGPAAVVAGVGLSAAEFPDAHFLLHGPRAELERLLERRPDLSGRVEIRDAPEVVAMSDKPSHVMRNGQKTSMWSAIDAVRAGEARVVVSCGNTGALMLVSMMRLKRLEGVNRPAIACFWPSRNPAGFNVMLDVGADVRADAGDLLQFALMGAAYAGSGLGLVRPRVGLLNVGTEENKGRNELKAANELLARAQETGSFDYVGFVEGSDIPSARVDVIVTDGFTGNVALKTGEGTASLVGDFMRDAFRSGLMSKLGALLAMGALNRMKGRSDPRRQNGGVFLGLNGAVVKSHGSADETGVAAAIGLARKLAISGLTEALAARVASAALAGLDAPADGATSGNEE